MKRISILFPKKNAQGVRQSSNWANLSPSSNWYQSCFDPPIHHLLSFSETLIVASSLPGHLSFSTILFPTTQTNFSKKKNKKKKPLSMSPPSSLFASVVLQHRPFAVRSLQDPDSRSTKPFELLSITEALPPLNKHREAKKKTSKQ
eukprot:TRINITY_DN13413_c1_g4_i1.p1 TRINITY_DN13413_c1_g4~~TRINITY_DN13413_c1_g4_i1.p1  ORF type:complete len:146 (-),score=17.48 TRINITY_DN13413_c1_g4_i1:603-1040(-)